MKQLNNDNAINIIRKIKEKDKLAQLKIENYFLNKNNFL